MADNIFKKTWTWVKDNPFKAGLIGVAVIGVLTIAFSKRVQTWLGLRKIQKALKGRKAKNQKALAGHTKSRKSKKQKRSMQVYKLK